MFYSKTLVSNCASIFDMLKLSTFFPISIKRQSFELLRQLDTEGLRRKSHDDKTLLHIAAQSHLPNMIEHIIQLIPDVIDQKVLMIHFTQFKLKS